MKLGTTMSDVKSEKPSVVIHTPDVEERKTENHTFSRRKYVMIVVPVVVFLMILTLAMTLSFYFLSRSHKEIISKIKFLKDENGNDIKETVEADLDANTAYVTEDQGNKGVYHFVHDYNRKLLTIRIDNERRNVCILLPMNGSKTVMEAIAQNYNNNIPKRRITVHIDPVPITNPDFLSQRAQTMCEGHTVHWAITTCEHSQENPSRLKRTTDDDTVIITDDSVIIIKDDGTIIIKPRPKQ